jgi:uncharacterized protein (DUF1697 family)
MPAAVALLRGINLGSRNRVAMPALRDALAEAGLPGARTYVQSGNIVLDTDLPEELLVARIEALIDERFGLAVPVVMRTGAELAAVVSRNPLREVAVEPKRHQVTFLSAPADPAVIERLAGAAVDGEAFASHGRELYAWHPDGIARSKLWNALAGKGLGVTATARNWTTVTALSEMAGG